MQIKNLYRYRGEGGTVDTTVLLPLEHEDMYRLSADAGKILTDGENDVSVIDIPVADLDRWTEIDEPTEDAEGGEE
jgi:hypothetical protein